MFKKPVRIGPQSNLKAILKDNGFESAADSFDYSGHSKNSLNRIIQSWNNFPKSMDIYPTTLTKKIYNEETTLYTKA